MNSSRLSLYLQSIRGPILLMTLGVLCALHQADWVSLRTTWPVLIIVVGVLVLAERLTAPPVVAAPYQRPAVQNPTAQFFGANPGVPSGNWTSPSYTAPPNPPPNPPAGGPR